MRDRPSRALRADTSRNVGTLWTLRQGGLKARCALLSWPDVWEVRVVMDGQTLVSERCVRTEEAFAFAERWRRELRARSWQQVVPPPAGPPAA